MNIGTSYSRRSIGVLLILLLLGTAAGAARAQTPEAACAADSLYLFSPSALEISLQETYPVGLTISWPDLDLQRATCFSLADTSDLAFSVSADGGFGDQVDRVIRFQTFHAGTVGGLQNTPLLMNWNHQGPTTYGSLAGLINLTNNGGIWRYSASAGTWTQLNEGLPMTWKQVNVVALAELSDGALVAGMTRGQTLDADPVGLYVRGSGVWSRIAADTFTNITLITRIIASPDDPDCFLVGTARSGLFVTKDGGATFKQWRWELDPEYPNLPPQYNVRALSCVNGRIYLAVTSFGVFRSDDQGNSFTRLDFEVPENLDAAVITMGLPTVNGFVGDPAHPNRVLALLNFHGIYQSDDNGANWHDLYGDLVVPDPETTGAWVHSAISAAIDPADPQRILMAVSQRGLYLSENGGENWAKVGQAVQMPNLALLTRCKILNDPANPGTVLVLEDGWGILRSTDGGSTWEMFPEQTVLRSGYNLVPVGGGGSDVYFGSHSGGIYRPGSPILLEETYTSGTSTWLRDLKFGLSVTFSEGPVDTFDTFRLVCQTFQGWAVWRAPAHDPSAAVMIGLYDKVNPEDCQEGYCGDQNINPIPQCYAAKRAACFNFDTPGTIRFFDNEVYNGFSYYYSVTTMDYGNTALVTAQNNTKEMLFSPRWDQDTLSPFQGHGNRTYIQVNLEAAAGSDGETIYAYPNPLRPGAGVPGGEGRTIVFTNLPPDSKIRIFTTAGDDVTELEEMRGGQIYWESNNRDGESVAPGVYLYKVIMPQRDDFWGRVVVIR